MDFENIYKSRKNILNLLKIRGYDIVPFENQTKEELNILYQNHSKKITYDIDTLDIRIDKKDDNNDEGILIKYILTEKCRAKNIEKIIDTLYTDIIKDNDTCIIITKDKTTYKGTLENYINKIYSDNNQFAQIFCLTDFLYDITQHILCPKYRILSKEESDKILNKFNISGKDLPEICVNDPLGSIYGVRVENIIEITYPSQTAGITINYRICRT